MKRWLVVIILTWVSLTPFGYSASLELQQMRASLKEFEDIGVEIPEDLQSLLAMLEQEEQQSPTSDADNPYGKKLSEMSCSDDITGLWVSSNELTTLQLQENGKALMFSSNRDGEFYTKISMQWSSSGKEFYVDYDYIRTYDSLSDTLQDEHKPKNETASCQYMGSMLKVGGQLYKR